jgi:hypothetical protein
VLVAGEMERRTGAAFTFATLAPRHARKQMVFLAWRPGATEVERARLELLRARLMKRNDLLLSADEIQWLDALWRRLTNGRAA